MSQDFVTQLRLQLREAALRQERRGSFAERLERIRGRLPGPAPAAAALALALAAVAVAFGAMALRGERQTARPEVVATYTVASGLSGLASGAGAVWTADPIAGEVLRIDRASGRVAARIPVGGDAIVGVGADSVWALAGDLQWGGDRGPVRLLRIDPGTNRIVARIPLRTPAGDHFTPVDLQAGPEEVWVVGAEGALLIDPTRNAGGTFVAWADEAGEEPRGAVTGGDDVWVLTVDGRLRQLAVPGGEVLGEVTVDAPPGAWLTGGRPGTLTLLGGREVTRIERASGRVLWRTALPGDVRAWTDDGEALWMHAVRDSAGPDLLVRVDPATGRQGDRVELPEPGGAGLAVVDDEIWVGTPAGRIVVVRP